MTSSTSPPVYLDKDGTPIRFKKRKARFTFSEVHILLDEVRKNRHIVVGKFNYGVPSSVKKRTWAEITARINEIGECEREVGEVIKKWSDMKCDTKRKVAAIRSGLKGCPPSRFLREFTPTENIIRNILELDGQQGRNRPSSSSSNGNGTRTSTAIGPVDEDDGGGEEDDDMDMDMAGMGPIHSSPEAGEGDRATFTGAMDSPSIVPPPLGTPAFTPVPSTSAITTPPPPLAGLKDESTEGDSLFDSSGDLSEYPFEMGFEIPFTEDSNQQADLDEDQANSSQLSDPTPISTANNSNTVSSAGVVNRFETSSLPAPSSTAPLPQPAASAPSPRVRPPNPDGSSGIVSGVAVSQVAVMSIEEQHMSNALLETVSRSLELLAESVQQLAETQQEFMNESLRIQRDTVQVLQDFATGAMTLMHDKLNGRPAL